MLKQIPNILTFGRLVLTVLFLAMLFYLPYVSKPVPFIDVAFVIFVVAGLTDIIDGKAAPERPVLLKPKFFPGESCPARRPR